MPQDSSDDNFEQAHAEWLQRLQARKITRDEATRVVQVMKARLEEPGPGTLAAAAALGELCLLLHRGIKPGYGRLPSRGVRMVNRNLMRFAERFVYSRTYSMKLRDIFSRTKQKIMFGVNAFLPMW